MREIKFRAYVTYADSSWFIYSDRYPEGLSDFFNSILGFDYELQQFTGISEKDVEVYEGDIVKVPHYQDNRKSIPGEVKFIDGSFVVDCVDMEYTFPAIEGKCEVVGNIYENSEMLEGKLNINPHHEAELDGEVND